VYLDRYEARNPLLLLHSAVSVHARVKQEDTENPIKSRYRQKIIIMNKGEELLDACKNGNLETVKKLTESTFSSKGVDVNVKDSLGRTALAWASHNGYTEIVKILIEKGVNVNEPSGSKKARALLLAALNGDFLTTKLLIESGANVNDSDIEGVTAIGAAANNGHKSIVELLIKNNANINVRDMNGVTPIEVASSCGYYEIVELLRSYGAARY